MSLRVWAIAWTAAYAVISSCGMRSSSSSNFHWFYSTLSANLWWFLEATHLHIHHIAVYIASWEFVCWTLIRISNTLILTGGVLSIRIAHRMIMLVHTSSNISVTLTHSAYSSKSFSISFILICHELSSVSAV